MKYCQYCCLKLSPLLNGNRKYCDVYCYAKEKSNRQKIQRTPLIDKKNKLKEAEKILQYLTYQYGNPCRINSKILESLHFDFSLTDKNVLRDGRLGTQIGQYAYVFNNEKETIIWKI